jgi:hypothetical protein
VGNAADSGNDSGKHGRHPLVKGQTLSRSLDLSACKGTRLVIGFLPLRNRFIEGGEK